LISGFFERESKDLAQTTAALLLSCAGELGEQEVVNYFHHLGPGKKHLSAIKAIYNFFHS